MGVCARRELGAQAVIAAARTVGLRDRRLDGSRAEPAPAVTPEDRAARQVERRGLTSAFAAMSLRYGLSVFPPPA